MSLCNNCYECVDPLQLMNKLQIDISKLQLDITNSINSVDKEKAILFYEMAIEKAKQKIEQLPTADYVIEQFSLMWTKICRGNISELKLLLTNKDMRTGLFMYLGAVVACIGGYLTFTTIENRDNNGLKEGYMKLTSSFRPSSSTPTDTSTSFSTSFLSSASSSSSSSNSTNDKNNTMNNTTPTVASRIATFKIWHEEKLAKILKELEDENDNEDSSLPTPSFSLSSFFKLIIRSFIWVVKYSKSKCLDFYYYFYPLVQENKENDSEKSNLNDDYKNNEKIENENIQNNKININTNNKQQTRHSRPKIPISISIPNPETSISNADENTISPLHLSSLTPAQLRKQFTIFLKAKKPQLLSLLQRLDMVAGIVAMLFILLLVFLYNKRIKHFISICYIPILTIISCYFLGKLCYIMYKWRSNIRQVRQRRVALIAVIVKKELLHNHQGWCL